MRSGIGFDVHRFDASRPLILGGVLVPDGPGLLGHSDADVICHAIGDALLGAAALGDLGEHFPDSDERWRGVSSLELLSRIGVLMANAGYSVHNVDAMVLIEAPRLSPWTPQMRDNIGLALSIPASSVGVKATTAEGLGFIGRGEGVACMAVAMIGAKQGA